MSLFAAGGKGGNGECLMMGLFEKSSSDVITSVWPPSHLMIGLKVLSCTRWGGYVIFCSSAGVAVSFLE